MEDLSLILASKELFLSLATQKVKTLKQASQLNKQHQNIKISTLLQEYSNINQKLANQLKQQSPKPWKNINLSSFCKDPLKYYMQGSYIVQVLGAKGSGKTALLLNLAWQYHTYNPENKIKIFNCAGGITMPRFSPFAKINCEYSDVFGVQDLMEVLQRAKNEKKVGLMVIDGQVNLLLGYQKQRIGLGQLIITLRDLGWSIYYTNYTQNKLEVDQKEATNFTGYFPQIFGGVSQCKLAIQPIEQSDNLFQITMLKSLDSKYYVFNASMDEKGLKDLQLIKN